MEHKIQSLQKLLEKAVNIKNEDSDDSDFIIWRKRVESTLIKLFGDNSVEFLAFKELKFYYNPVMFYLEVITRMSIYNISEKILVLQRD